MKSGLIRNTVSISVRTLKQSPVYTAILAVGFGVSISLLLIAVSFAWDRTARDQFHPHPDRMYRVTTEASGTPFPYATSPPSLWKELTTSVRGVDLAARFRLHTETFARGDDRFPHRALVASPSFFDLFGFSVLAGDARSALYQPTSVVLSASRARSLFGTTNAIGRTVTVAGRGSRTVRAVVDTDRVRSHIRFDAVYPLDARAAWAGGSQHSWPEFRSGYTYLRLSPGASPKAVEDRICRAAREHWPETTDPPQPPVFHLQALSDVLFGETRANEIGGEKIPATVIHFLGALAVLVILAASFNYVSLGTARSLQRAKEVGIRKTLGGTRRGILLQFSVESIGVSLLAFVSAGLRLRPS